MARRETETISDFEFEVINPGDSSKRGQALHFEKGETWIEIVNLSNGSRVRVHFGSGKTQDLANRIPGGVMDEDGTVSYMVSSREELHALVEAIANQRRAFRGRQCA